MSSPAQYPRVFRSLLGIFALALLLATTGSQAQIVVSVSATVPGDPPEPPPTIIIFRGLAYPGSDVTIRQNGTILATVPADPQARFDVSINIAPGIYNFTVFGEDVLGRVGRSSTFNVSLTEGTTTTISGIFLAPTIEINDTQFDIGETVTLLGASAPLSEVSLFVASEEQILPTTAGSDGLWSRSFIASTVGVGSHTARAKAVATDASISEFSDTLAFQVSTSDACGGALAADINCDGRVDLVDFSILLFYWQQSNPANARADINDDTTVNLTDFSIMLFHWTG